MKQAKQEIEKILNNEYGVGIAVAPVNAVLWAADKCSNPDIARQAANKVRSKYGKCWVYAQ